jgi:hypothetical protein
MAGRLTVSTLNNDTGVFATQNAISGIAKAWVNFTGGSTIRAAFNVSSVTKNSNGFYTLNFTTVMDDTNYVVITNSGSPNSGSYETSGVYTPSNSSYGTKTTSAVQVNYYTPAVSNYDPFETDVVIFR